MTISGIENSTVAQAFSTQSASEDRSIRPFTVQVPQAELEDLRRRINATRWPDKETVDDRSQGTQLAKLQELVRYWGTDYDWRKVEATLNALPQFITTIDGLDCVNADPLDDGVGRRGSSPMRTRGLVNPYHRPIDPRLRFRCNRFLNGQSTRGRQRNRRSSREYTITERRTKVVCLRRPRGPTSMSQSIC